MRFTPIKKEEEEEKKKKKKKRETFLEKIAVKNKVIEIPKCTVVKQERKSMVQVRSFMGQQL